MKKIIICILAALCLTGCAPSADRADADLNPQLVRANTTRSVVTLYYGSRSENLLVPEPRTINISESEMVEVTVLEELISGPEGEVWEVAPLINDDTTVVMFEEEGDLITVTLSAEFLESGEGEDMKLAVYSVVNTLVELSGYSRVQILVDTQGTGNGQRVAAQDLGFEGIGVLEPLERNETIVLDAQKTAELIFEYIRTQNHSALSDFVANFDGDEKPSEAELQNTLNALTNIPENQMVRDVIISGDSESAVVMVDFTKRLPGSDLQVLTNIPLRLVKENYVYKMRYSDFERMFLS